MSYNKLSPALPGTAYCCGTIYQGWVHKIYVLFVQPVFGQAQTFAEALEVDDLPGTQELDGIIDVRIIGQAQNVVVGQARLLFGGQILRQVGDHVAGNADGACRPGKTGRRSGIDSCGMIHKVGVKSGSPDVLVGQVSRQLVNNSPHHLQVSQFFCADVGKQALQLSVGHGVPLAKIAQRSAQFAVRATGW